MDRTSALRPRPALHGSDFALFLDVDGCLIEFTTLPDAVVVSADLRQLLQRLSESLDGAIALISGRSIAALDALFWPLEFKAAGLHGNQLRDHDGMRRSSLDGCESTSRVLAEAVALCLNHPGAVVEDKGSGLALHWRAAPQSESALRSFAEDALSRLPSHRLQPGNCVIELVRGDQDKGKAIAALLENAPFRGRCPVFMGDDLTDESGFRAVNALGGVSVLVGARDESAANFSLSDPADVRAWLATFANGVHA